MHPCTFNKSLDYKLLALNPYVYQNKYFPSPKNIPHPSTFEPYQTTYLKYQLQVQAEVQRKLLLQPTLQYQRSSLLFEDLIKLNRRKDLLVFGSPRPQNYSQSKYTCDDKRRPKTSRQFRSEIKSESKYPNNPKNDKLKSNTSGFISGLKQYQRKNNETKQLIQKKITPKGSNNLNKECIGSRILHTKRQVTDCDHGILLKQIQELKNIASEREQKISIMIKKLNEKQKRQFVLSNNEVNVIIHPLKNKRLLSICNSTFVKIEQKDGRQSFLNTTETLIKNVDMKEFQLKQTLFLEQDQPQNLSENNQSASDINIQSISSANSINYQTLTQSIQFNNDPVQFQRQNVSLQLSVSQVMASDRRISKNIQKNASQLEISLNLSIQKPQYVKNIKKKELYEDVELASQSIQAGMMKKRLAKLESYSENISIIKQQQSIQNSQYKKSLNSEFSSISNERVLQNLAKNGYYFQGTEQISFKNESNQQQN